jgi:hypothetical protein
MQERVFPDTEGSFHLAIRCTKAIGGSGITVILGNFHLERPLKSWKDPQGSFQGVFPWDIIDGVGCRCLKLEFNYKIR